MDSFTMDQHDGTLNRRLDSIEAKLLLLEGKLDLLVRILDGLDGLVYGPCEDDDIH